MRPVKRRYRFVRIGRLVPRLMLAVADAGIERPKKPDTLRRLRKHAKHRNAPTDGTGRVWDLAEQEQEGML